MSAQLDALVTQVDANSTVIGSAQTLIAGLAKTIADIQAQLAADNIDNATLNDLQQKLSASDQALTAAVVANTPQDTGTLPPAPVVDLPPADGTPPADGSTGTSTGSAGV